MAAMPPPMKLPDGMPRMSIDMKARVESCLSAGCVYCRATTAKLTRRTLTNGISHPALQCDGCGRSLSGAMKRADHYEFNQYPLFDDARLPDYMDGRTAESREIFEAKKAQVAFETQSRSGDYLAQLRASPEWRALRQKVLARARFVCEACLNAQPEHVHHLTYQFGILPPAWILRAVCKACHHRLHADKNGGQDEWSPKR